jgi:predicted DNA-binding protein YlxM (UPF0122 family)
VAYSTKDWETVRAYYELGLSLSEIVAKKDVKITSKSQISRKATKEGWEKATEKQQLIDLEVNTKQAVADIEQKKATLNATELKVHNAIVDERTKHIQFFTSANMLIATTVVKKLRADGVNASYTDTNAAANALMKAQEGVLGKAPSTVINNTNATQNNVSVNTVSPEERERLRKAMHALY